MLGRNFDILIKNVALKAVYRVKHNLACAQCLLQALMQRRVGMLPATARRPQRAAMWYKSNVFDVDITLF